MPTAVHSPAPIGVFEMILWQPNPSSSDGQLVPTDWNAASMTGFAPASPLNSMQLGFQNAAGTSTAQMDGDTVGAYLNSADLPGSPVDQKMMITPQFTFTAGSEPVPFASAGSTLGASMDLQIPVASGPSTYVLADFLFLGPGGLRISYGIKIFTYDDAPSVVGGVYDPPSGSYQLNSPLIADQLYVTLAPGSAAATGTPWVGWQHFAWSISQAQFIAALTYLASEYPSLSLSTDPSQYVLSELHLNAEMHFQPDPADLGWSMRGWQVWTTTGN